MPDEKVHNYEPFLHLWTFSKTDHKLCPKTSVVSVRFMNRSLWTLYLWTNFFQTVHNYGPFYRLIFYSPSVQKPQIYEPIYEPISACTLRIKTHLNWHEWYLTLRRVPGHSRGCQKTPVSFSVVWSSARDENRADCWNHGLTPVHEGQFL